MRPAKTPISGRKKWVISSLLGSVLLVGTASAEGGHSGDEHHEEIPNHHLGLFIGSGWETKRDGHEDDKGLALGLEYVYKFHRRWGIGGVFETLGDETIREITVIVPVSFYPGAGWRLVAGPGIETTETKEKAMVRLGVGYNFHLGKWSISPEGFADYVEGGAVIWIGGVAFGYRF